MSAADTNMMELLNTIVVNLGGTRKRGKAPRSQLERDIERVYLSMK